MGKALVFLETFERDVRSASLEALEVARKYYDNVLGFVAVDSSNGLESKLSRYVHKLYIWENSKLNYPYPKPIAKIISELADKEDVEAVFFASTVVGKEIAPLVGAFLDAPVIEEITSFEDKDVVVKPVVSNKAYAHIRIHAGRRVLGIKPKAFPVAEPLGKEGEVEKVDADLDTGKVHLVSLKPKQKGEIDVTEADIVVSGGRGLGGPENFQILRELIDALSEATGLKVALGASRAAVDAGWIDHSHQVGQTGKTVSPLVYFAIGISGAIQHLAGMRTSKYIVAINKDPEAPIFKVADYGLVGDLFKIVPELTRKIREAKRA